ncbi:MAG: LCP family protein [Bifidobacterium psychraerophilum]|uniref:LCP family protein n=1 Tax=Bifidobacterium psychraerophilum TaxID=218140 RepID=UPI0039E9AB21
MAQESGEHETWDNPPSFMPSRSTGHSASRGGQANDTSAAPPSFSPRNGSSTPTPSQAAPRGGRSSAPSRSASGSSRAAGPQRQSPAKPVRNGAKPISASSQPKHKNTGRKKHGAGRIIARILIVLVILLALIGIGLWSWVNGQLNKKDMLSSAADTPASTWLILGSDERDGTAGTGTEADAPGSRTDTILVLTKPKSGPSSLVSIPRDSLVTVKNTNMKINAVAETYGYTSLVEQVETITGQKIDHVAMIKFGGLEKVVNALGGVELCYDSTVNDAYSGLNWTAGCHTADGATALAFSRMRYSDPQGDFGRAKRQRQVIAAIVSKASKASTLTNFSKSKTLASSALSAIVVDNKSNPWTLLQMALAFKAASGSNGVTGSVYWTDPDYYPGGGVGSTVKLDADRNLTLFTQLADGSHASGTVGGQD